MATTRGRMDRSLTLFRTSDVPDVAVARVVAAMPVGASVRASGRIVFRSIVSQSAIELAGPVVAWLPIAAIATGFLQRLAKRGADALADKMGWGGTHSGRKHPSEIERLAQAIVSTRPRRNARWHMTLLMESEAARASIELETTTTSARKMGMLLAWFAVAGPEAIAALEGAHPEPRRRLAGTLTPHGLGDLEVEWRDRRGTKRRLVLNGKALLARKANVRGGRGGRKPGSTTAVRTSGSDVSHSD
jgi:hypothetical protein